MSNISKLTVAALAAVALSAATPAFASPEAVLSLSVATPSGAVQSLEFRGTDGWRVVNQGGVQSVKLSLSETSASADNAAAQPLAVFLDRPTGSTFVYLPEAGWKYLGRSEFGGTAKADTGSMTLFIDGPSAFVYRYAADQGWTFAGRVGDRKL